MDHRTRRMEATKAGIRSAATRLFFSRGYREVTMADIGREVGLAAGSLYHYYRNKEEILKAIDAECMKESERVMEAICAMGKDLRTTILDFLRGVYEFARNHREYFLFLTRAVAAAGPELVKQVSESRSELHRKLVGRLAALMEDLKKRGEVRSDLAPEELGHLLIGLVHAAMSVRFIGGVREDEIPQMFERFATAFMEGVRKGDRG